MNSDLILARILWSRGEPVPVDTLMRLAAQGYDVARLERKHSI